MTGVRAAVNLSILYRGPLASCNYDCPYCPFAKRRDPPEQLRADRAALERFAAWVAATTDRPALGAVHPVGRGADPLLVPGRPRDALAPAARRTGSRSRPTSAARSTGWPTPTGRRRPCGRTYHPGQVTPGPVPRPLRRDWPTLGVRYSRRRGRPARTPRRGARRCAPPCPPAVYLWVNAAEGHRYTAAEEATLDRRSTRFRLQRPPAPVARTGPAAPGESAISVAGDGTVRRCHFVRARSATSTTARGGPRCAPGRARSRVCDCHIGYVHLETLGLYDVFAGGVLERIPAAWPVGIGPGPAR